MKHHLRRWVEWVRAKPPSVLNRAGLTPGTYHYLRESGGGTYTRFHLRIDPSGGGLLLANATAAARLHPSGVIIAKGLLEGEPTDATLARLEKAFAGLKPEQARDDIAAVAEIIATLDTPGDNYPILNLGDPSFSPKVELLDRPLSADVSLAEPEHVRPILDRLWELGIAHATMVALRNFEPTWLVQAVQRAQDLGMIAGVRGRATDLGQGRLVEDLAQAGVDHVNVLYPAAQSELHDVLAGPGDHARAVEVIGRVQSGEVCVVAEVPLVRSTLSAIEDTLDDIARLGVHNAGFYALASADPPSEPEPLHGTGMVQAARAVEEASADASVRYLWYAPLRFTPSMSLAEQVQLGPRCSGDLSVRVEPDGTVLAARGPASPAGNLLRDPWETIAAGPVYSRYHRRLLSDTHCDDCPGLAVCAADCPRDPAGWAEVIPACRTS